MNPVLLVRLMPRTPRKVTFHHVNEDENLVDVEVRSVDGEESVLHTTEHHPFWDKTTKLWTDAGKLIPNHELATSDGSVATVTTVADNAGRQTMYNLTVADIHTYYEGYSQVIL